jgi:hypothetical protein
LQFFSQFFLSASVDFDFIDAPGPDLFLSGLFLRLKLGLPVGLGGAGGPVRP